MVTELEKSTREFRKFCGFGDCDTLELVAFGGRQKIQVAYARSLECQLRLLSEAETQPELKGTYSYFNLIHEGLYARIGENRWRPGAPHASDNEVTELRGVYCDFDVDRPRDISSTDSEKASAREVAAACRDYLTSALGTDACFGLGDSGNGYSLFVAVEPIKPTKDTTAKVKRFLSAMATKFARPGIVIDVSVCNPARLCPAFGTLKRKGVHCPERPHRLTSFRCAELVTRMPLEALA
jgi:hypothetical protein